MAFGVGIHGEPALTAAPSLPSIRPLMKCSIPCWENGNYSRTLRHWDNVQGAWQEGKESKRALQSGDRVIALVNNLGATPLSELFGVYTASKAVARTPASSLSAT